MDTKTSKEPAVAVGYDIGGTEMKIAAMGAGNSRPLHTQKIPTPKTYRDFLEGMRNLFAELKRAQNNLNDKVIGVGMPGVLDRARGQITLSNNLPWVIGKPLRADLERVLVSEVALENDANCFVLAEANVGAGAAYDFVMGVILGTGLGGGMVINKRLHVGPHGFTGEYGGNPLPWAPADAPPAIEAFAGKENRAADILSAPGLVKLYKAFGGNGGDDVTAVTVMHRYRANEEPAQKAFRYFVDAVARMVAQKVHDIDPNTIVFGGGLSNIDELYGLLPNLVSRYLMRTGDTPTPLRTPLKKASLGDAAGSIGAALLTRQVKTR